MSPCHESYHLGRDCQAQSHTNRDSNTQTWHDHDSVVTQGGPAGLSAPSFHVYSGSLVPGSGLEGGAGGGQVVVRAYVRETGRWGQSKKRPVAARRRSYGEGDVAPCISWVGTRNTKGRGPDAGCRNIGQGLWHRSVMLLLRAAGPSGGGGSRPEPRGGPGPVPVALPEGRERGKYLR